MLVLTSSNKTVTSILPRNSYIPRALLAKSCVALSAFVGGRVRRKSQLDHGGATAATLHIGTFPYSTLVLVPREHNPTLALEEIWNMPHFSHPCISQSPVQNAFPFIEWNAPIALSRPEQALLQSAEETPLEYTLAEFGDTFAYARLLLKVLDQVTGPSNPGRVSELPLDVAAGQGLDDEEALQYLAEDKTGVVTHYLISKLYEMMGLLTERPSHSPVQISTIFYQHNKLLEDWRPLLRLLYRPGDPYSQRGAALCLMYILQAGCRDDRYEKIPMVEETLQSLVSWLTSRLQSSHATSLGVVTPTLLVLGTCRTARIVFDNAGGIGYLARHLRPKTGTLTAKRLFGQPSPQAKLRRPSSNISNGGSNHSTNGIFNGSITPPRKYSGSSLYGHVSVQQLYELCFCLWTMTYECGDSEDVRHHFARDGAIPALADLVAAAPREKVVRLALASLRSLAQVDSKLFVPEMIACRLLKSVNLLREQKQWSDPDILEGTC